MDCLGEHTSLKHSELEYLTKYSTNNDEYADILKATKECLSIQELWMTLFQMAVVHNNLTLIKYLSRSGPDYINAQNSSGDVPLLMAINSYYFEMVKILLDAGADVSVIDSSTKKTALGLLLRPNGGFPDMIPDVMGNLKKCNFKTEKLAALLVSAKCPLEHVITMNDAQVSKEFLKRDTQGNLELAMDDAMKRLDFVNVELMLRHGNVTGRQAFYQTLCALIDINEMELWKFFIERLADWDVITRDDLWGLDLMFQLADVEYLQVLFDCKIDLHVREKFGIDLRVGIFGSRRVDAIELLQNQNFDVNAAGIKQQTALHFAVTKNLTTNVRFLLDSGADLNIKDEEGRTALFHCIKGHSIESGQLLLEHGADVQVTGKNGLTILEFALHKDSALLEFILAQIAFSHVQGVAIKPAIQMEIDECEDYKNTFETCCQQLQALKTREVIESATLFDILSGKIETLYRFLRDKDFLAILDQYKEQHDLHSLYYFKIMTKLRETSNLYRFSCRFAEIISEKTATVVDFDHLVVSAISRYLTKHDLQEFLISMQ